MPDRTQPLSLELTPAEIEALLPEIPVPPAEETAVHSKLRALLSQPEAARPVGDRTQTLSVALSRDDLEVLRILAENDHLELLAGRVEDLLSQPEHQGDESEWQKLMDAPIQRPGKVYVKHDNEAGTGEWMDGEQVNALVRSLRQPPAPVLSEEVKERLNEIADELDRLVDSREDIIQSPLSKATFLRNLASQEHREEVALTRSPAECKQIDDLHTHMQEAWQKGLLEGKNLAQGDQERWKVDDDYPVRASKPDGCERVFDDLLKEGDEVGLGPIPEDSEDRDARPPYGRVVRESDGLWIVLNTDAEERQRSERIIADCNPAPTQRDFSADETLTGKELVIVARERMEAERDPAPTQPQSGRLARQVDRASERVRSHPAYPAPTQVEGDECDGSGKRPCGVPSHQSDCTVNCPGCSRCKPEQPEGGDEEDWPELTLTRLRPGRMPYISSDVEFSEANNQETRRYVPATSQDSSGPLKARLADCEDALLETEAALGSLYDRASKAEAEWGKWKITSDAHCTVLSSADDVLRTAGAKSPHVDVQADEIVQRLQRAETALEELAKLKGGGS